jgi:DNA-binding SARP family transcriptional activator
VVVAGTATARPDEAPERLRLRLLDGFELRCGTEVLPLPPGGRRLIALLGLRAAATREQAAGLLWPEASGQQAGGRLRTTLWRVHSTGQEIVDGRRGQLALSPHVEVDVSDWQRRARQVLDGEERVDAGRLVDVATVGELLPGWYEDWVLLERERLWQLQLHTLEAASGHLLGRQRYADALDAAIRVLQLDPTRESAHRAVIRVHLAEGNLGEAARQFESCRAILRREFGVGPSPLLQALLGAPQPMVVGPRPAPYSGAGLHPNATCGDGSVTLR